MNLLRYLHELATKSHGAKDGAKDGVNIGTGYTVLQPSGNVNRAFRRSFSHREHGVRRVTAKAKRRKLRKIAKASRRRNRGK